MRSWRFPLIAALITALLVGGISSADALRPNADSSQQATAAAKKKKKKATTRGPRGFRGARGPIGPEGPRGAAGASGLGDLVVRGGDQVNLPSSGPVYGEGNAQCKAGEQAVSGGVQVYDPAGTDDSSSVWNTYVVQSTPETIATNNTPNDGRPPVGWHAGVVNRSAVAGAANRSVAFRVWVVCAG